MQVELAASFIVELIKERKKTLIKVIRTKIKLEHRKGFLEVRMIFLNFKNSIDK